MFCVDQCELVAWIFVQLRVCSSFYTPVLVDIFVSTHSLDLHVLVTGVGVVKGIFMRFRFLWLKLYFFCISLCSSFFEKTKVYW